MEAHRQGDGSVLIGLSVDEAVVLSAMLDRWEQAGVDRDPLLEDQSERRVLWNLNAALECHIDVLFSPEYAEELRAARERVRDPDYGPNDFA